MANFNTEREGQLDFYSTFLPMIDPALQMEDLLADDNDGVLNGNLLEFKLRISVARQRKTCPGEYDPCGSEWGGSLSLSVRGLPARY